jgi:hypothetical protein
MIESSFTCIADLIARPEISTDGRKHGRFQIFSIVRVPFRQWEDLLNFKDADN